MKQSLISSWMSTPVVAVSPEMALSEARKIMNAENIRSLPVIAGGELVGIVTRRGLLRADLSSLDEQSWASRLPDLSIERIMTRGVITTSPNTLVPKAARAMAENKITALPVVDRQKRVVGMVTSADMLRVIIAELPFLKERITVRDYMTPDLVTVTPETALLEAHRLMAVERIRSLPVVNGDQLAGIVTRTDLLSADHPAWLDTGKDAEIARRIESQPVSRLMSSPVRTVEADVEIIVAARLLLAYKIRSLPVVDAEQKLVGILTETDLFNLITRKFF